MGEYAKILKDYLLKFPDEAEKFKLLEKQINQQSDSELINRKNFVGHFTASAFLISRKSGKIVLLYHNFLKKYLQPGGHIDDVNESPLSAALRELQEETGISADKIELFPVDFLNEATPFNIDIHNIPENSKKNELGHYHYDLQYLFFCGDDLVVKIDENESNSFEWVDWGEFLKMPDFYGIAKKINKILK